MARDWSNLNHDMLRLIAGKIRTLEDFTRVGAVCKDWMDVLMNQTTFGRTQLPWLILPCDHEHDPSQCHDRRCFSMMENKVHELYFPEAVGKKCVGSSHGWLIMVEDVSPDIFMLNPLTKQRIELPSVTTMPKILGFNKEDVGDEYIVKSIFDGLIETMSLKDMERIFTLKIILSNHPEEEDCIAVALCGIRRRLIFCRIGDNKWTEVQHDLKAKPAQEDVIYSKGKFYVVTCHATVGVFDARNPKVTTILDTPSGINKCDDMYLVIDTTGKLLLISRSIDIYDSISEYEDDKDDDDNNDFDSHVERLYEVEHDAVEDDYDGQEEYEPVKHFYMTKEFNIFRLNEVDNEWTKVRDIGENVIFLGENHSLCYSTIEFPECIGNSIYFTHGEWKGGIYKGHDIGIFNIEDGSIRKIPCFKQDMPLRDIFPPAVWFTPAI